MAGDPAVDIWRDVLNPRQNATGADLSAAQPKPAPVGTPTPERPTAQNGDTMSAPQSVVQRAMQELREQGIATPGSSLHSWRCEHPDRYGHCNCAEEAAQEFADALYAASAGHALREAAAALHDPNCLGCDDTDSPLITDARWLRERADLLDPEPT